jgi:hypothetical protein
MNKAMRVMNLQRIFWVAGEILNPCWFALGFASAPA